MKIGFDVSDLCTNRADGTTRYTWELLKRLPALEPAHQWHAFAPCKLSGAYTSFAWHASPWPNFWTQTRLPADLYRYTPDVLFMPIQQLPYVRPGRMRTVAVIHDLAVHYYPEQFTYKQWLLLHLFSAYATREADELIAVSRATAEDIKRWYGRDRRVHVVHHGVDHDQFRLPREGEAATFWKKLKQRYPTLRQPYVLYVGQIQPRKNLVRLISAFELLIKKKPELALVIAGAHGWKQRGILDRIHRSPARSSIIMTGRVPPELLPALYWHAEVFTLPSLYEGFGMPILEAMACGVPVVTSNVSSMPEVAGSSGLLVDPVSVESIADGITKAIAEHDDRSRRGIEHARQFTWEKTARSTLAVIEAASEIDN